MAHPDRSGGARVSVVPRVVRPRQKVTATVMVTEPIGEVASARLEWGYDNFYRGGESDTDDWVCVSRVEIPVAAAEFAGTSSSFTVPSWAAGSSPELVRWACRLLGECGGRDVDARGVFGVVIGMQDVDPVEAVLQPVEHYRGGRDSDLDIVLATAVWRAGEPVTGHLAVRPRQSLPAADIAVYWQRQRDHHPLSSYPAQVDVLDGPPLPLGTKIPMRNGADVDLPFALPLAADSAPTGEAVHSSVSWFVGARISYSGPTGPLSQRSRRPIVVVNA